MTNGDKTFYFGVDFLKDNWYKTKRTCGVCPAHTSIKTVHSKVGDERVIASQPVEVG